jgi:type I restriction enzyme S subunit
MSFPRYPAYKPSGVEWLGEVPEHWEVLPLRRLIREVISGTSVNAIDEPAEPGQAGVLKTSCVYTGDFRPEENKAILESELDRATCSVVAGSLVVSRMNTPDLVGAAGLVKNDDPFLFLPDRLWQVSFRDCAPAFMNYWCKSVSYRTQVQLACSGTSSSMQNLSQDNFYSFIAPLPPTGEQVAIASFLDRETAKIDALIAEQQRLIELLQEKRQAVISHAVSKGLNPDVPLKDSGVEWLGEVPEHWRVMGLTKTIGPIVDYRGRTPSKCDSGTLLVTARNIRSGEIDYSLSEEYVDPLEAEDLLQRGRPVVGDVLFTMEAPLGQVALVDREDIALAQRVVKFRGIPDRMNNSFLVWWLTGSYCQDQLSSLSTGSTALGIKASKLSAIRCLVPPIGEQLAIDDYIRDSINRLSQIREAALSQIALLQERRFALISASVTGQIDVRGLVPGADAA